MNSLPSLRLSSRSADRSFRSAIRSSAGMTLIELMVGMAVVGIILSITVAGFRNLTDAEMKNASSQLASTIRFLYNKSATERVYLRMVYDISKNSYHVEAASEPFVITEIDEDERGRNRDEDEEAESTAGTFTPTESFLLKPVKMSGDVFFKDIQVSYAKEPIASGKAYTYFFPNGFATPTIINLRDDDDETNYSLHVRPLSGRVSIESDYRELDQGS